MCAVPDDTDIYILMLYIAKHWQLIDGVHVPVWYSSLQLPTQEKNKQSSRNELRKSSGYLFLKWKIDSDDDMISDADWVSK